MQNCTRTGEEDLVNICTVLLKVKLEQSYYCNPAIASKGIYIRQGHAWHYQSFGITLTILLPLKYILMGHHRCVVGVRTLLLERHLKVLLFQKHILKLFKALEKLSEIFVQNLGVLTLLCLWQILIKN